MKPPADTHQRPVRIIAPSLRRRTYQARDAWDHRELIYFLAWRDIKIRYRQTVLGAAWAILQPLSMMLIFTVLFGRLASLQEKVGPVPYSAFALTGLVPWTFFAAAVNASSHSVVSSVQLITKTAFPRFLIPVAAIGAVLVDFLVGLAALVALLVFWGEFPTWRFAFLPVVVAGTVFLALGVGTLCAAVSVTYRDFRFIVPFVLQIVFFATPVIYPPSLLPANWSWILLLNPLTGLIESFRAVLLSTPIQWEGIVAALLHSIAWAVVGGGYFGRVERRVADVI
jgi:lipopolysaccharide transport system permease protein